MAKKNIPESLKSYFCIFLILTQTTESRLFSTSLAFLDLIHLNLKESQQVGP